MFQGIDQKDDSYNHDSSRENDDSDVEPGKFERLMIFFFVEFLIIFTLSIFYYFRAYNTSP